MDYKKNETIFSKILDYNEVKRADRRLHTLGRYTDILVYNIEPEMLTEITRIRKKLFSGTTLYYAYDEDTKSAAEVFVKMLSLININLEEKVWDNTPETAYFTTREIKDENLYTINLENFKKYPSFKGDSNETIAFRIMRDIYSRFNMDDALPLAIPFVAKKLLEEKRPMVGNNRAIVSSAMENVFWAEENKALIFENLLCGLRPGDIIGSIRILDINDDFMKDIEILEPYGIGFSYPIFRITDIDPKAIVHIANNVSGALIGNMSYIFEGNNFKVAPTGRLEVEGIVLSTGNENSSVIKLVEE